MERDLRHTPLFTEIETFYRSALEPGFGLPTAFGDPVPSPDGAWVAVAGEVRTSMDALADGRLFLVAAAGGELRQITYGPHDDLDPQWSPDGSRLSFRSDRGSPGRFQLYELATDAVGEARPLPSIPGVVEHHRWSPDGTRLLLVVAGEAAEQADALGSGSLAQSEDLPDWIPDVDASDSTDEWRRLWVLDVATGVARLCSRDGLNVWEASWLGDEHASAIVSEAASEGAWYTSPLAVIDLATGMERVVLRSAVQLGYAEGAPDGRTIAVQQAVCSDRYLVMGDLLLVDTVSGGVVTVDTGGVDVSSTTWRPDGSLLVAGVRGLETLVLDVPSGSHVAEKRYATTESVSYLQPRVAPLGAGFVATVASSSRPPAVVRVEAGASTLLANSHHRGHDASRSTWADHRTLTWTAPDGQVIEGMLTTPLGPPPYALLLNVHGGPVWGYTHSWVLLYEQLLLSRGYAILSPNPRGSTGRGQAFAGAVVGDMGGADALDLLAGIDRLVADGVADPERLGVFGGSYGGFMAAWLPSIDARFKAAVAMSPVTDWYSEHFGSSLVDWVAGFLADQPERVGGAHHERSPVLAGERLRTPTLLSAGLRDRATPPTQAVEFYRALVAQGVPSEVVIYPQEGHGVRHLPAAIDLSTRMVAWFERFMPAR